MSKRNDPDDGPTQPVPGGDRESPTRPVVNESSADAPTRRVRAGGRFTGALRSAFADTTPLRTPAYRRLWTAGIVTVIGAQLAVVAVPTQIYQMTGSSAYVGLTGLFGLVPLVVFGLWGGAIADAVDRRVMLLFTGSGIALTSLALWVVSASGVGDVWLVLVLFAIQSAMLAMNQPTRSAVIPRLLPAEQLPAANALNMTVVQVGAVLGPLLAGILIPIIGLPMLYLLDAIALLATLWATWRLPPLPSSAQAAGGRRPKVGLRAVVDGFRYVGMHRILLVSFLVDVIAMGLGMPRVMFPEMAEQTFGDPPGGGIALGMLFAAIPIGMVAGGVLSGWLQRVERQGVAVVVAICVWGGGIALFGLTGSLFLAVLALAVAGAGDLVSSVYRSSMLQTVATDEMRGRMQGVFIVVVAGGPRLADMWHGASADVIGPGTTATLGGLAVIVGTLVVVARFPEFWRYRAPVAGRDPG
ncbi:MULTISPECIES: MFS transporter [Pseudonocardia]|uniref:Enterobactin exporter EntS n=2 Tax=Pseudonocardia TaxID=1847 RepID=A0A1Y2MSB5_PSEAH|nr:MULTISPECIES: MFS transporter [Pseudonocardia]OSY38116.1 Enterobactin exporter EntS [Pseudonocardia autotrophica]TDN75557.1 putative MFS family arabinose efflux permease [Pseudonocardia autotrophica]BBF99527.1 MFS transporter [Pseudonocardia autotrophica]GEC29258.1 MFS transporter [Pseudonocardia saturnea]